MSALTLLLGSALAAPSTCPEPVTVGAFEAQLQLVEDDAAATAESVPRLVDAAVAAVPCLAAPIPTATAARLHRLVGLKASLVDELAGLPAFMAARALEPDAPLLSTIDLSDSGPGASYASVDPAQVAWDTPPPAAGAALHIDGQSPGRHSARLPAVVQLAGASGLRWSHYIAPGEPLPGYPVASTLPDAPPPEPTPEPTPDGADLAAAPAPTRTAAAPLRWSGVGMLVAAGALYGGSWLSHSTIAGAAPGSLSAGEATSAQSLTNGLTVASGVGLGVGAGLLGASFLVGR